MTPVAAIRLASTTDDLAALVAITAATTPEESTTLDELR